MKSTKKPTYQELEEELSRLRLQSSNQEEEFKTAQSKAQEYEKRFRILMLNMEAGVIIHAPDTSIAQNNKRASEILGLSEEQLKGKTAIDPDWKFVNLDKTPIPFEEYPINRIATTKRPIKSQIIGSYHPDKGHIVWATVSGFPVLDQNDEISEIVTIFIDITEKKKNEEEKQANQLKLEKAERELTKSQKLAHVGNWIYNPGDAKPEWSEEMFRIWGFDPKEDTPPYEPDIANRVHPDDLELFNSAFKKAINPGIPYDIEFRVCIPGAEQKVVRSIFEPARDERGEVIISGTNQDITVQKQFEHEQIKHQRLKAIGEMSSSIAHDFNNALQEMMGNLEVIKLQNTLPDTTLERLNTIGSIISDTAGRVSALQKFGNPISDDNNNGLINLNVLIEESLKQSRPLWKDGMEKEGRRIQVKTHFQEIPKISCPRGEIKSVVFNLIKNSVEAMPEGGDLIIKTGQKNGNVFATFTDTGLGMDAETKMKVFEPFFTTKGFNPGRGLGMSGAYTIVKKCKGAIGVKYSELYKGTTIEMAFPISSQAEVKATTEGVSQSQKNYRVLWVDDDFIITKSSGKMVESIGHYCATVNSGKKALEYLEKNPCDLVFTDIGMPKMNGWELAEAIREKHGDQIKIIAVTGWDMREKVEDENAIDLFLQKPFTMADLKLTLGKITKLLESAKSSVD
jgi:PAS domain S-box-containing protein